ncbi:unnamed protein product [Blepharisma stoltei]|uniref:Uncharacterized protein n=1 Tax=Blepharisma stoltei TaxID=1481888 RepID=A0AAU9IWE7_9CILI|nr:unnamed protein product [Blepharisma stoltei]
MPWATQTRWCERSVSIIKEILDDSFEDFVGTEFIEDVLDECIDYYASEDEDEDWQCPWWLHLLAWKRGEDWSEESWDEDEETENEREECWEIGSWLWHTINQFVSRRIGR